MGNARFVGELVRLFLTGEELKLPGRDWRADTRSLFPTEASKDDKVK